jgi:sugar lactone lactonase YvrE
MSDYRNGNVFRIAPDAEVTLLATLPGNNNRHLKYHDGELIVAARGAHQIYSVSLDGSIELIAGSGETGVRDGIGVEAALGFPNAIAIGPDGEIYFNHSTGESNATIPTAIRVIRIAG